MTRRRTAPHPSDALLAAHAAGWIPWPADLCVRVHLETCAQCQESVADFEDAEAAFVDALPEAPMTSEALGELLATLAATPVEASAPQTPASLGDVQLPDALAPVEFGRRRWLGPGLWLAHARTGRADGWRTYVLRAPAGQRLPAHTHTGPELTCVLAGAVEDEHTYVVGDFIENPGASRHTVTVGADGPCACLIATQGPLRFSGLARLLSAAIST